MSTAEQIKTLIRTHLSDDTERFYTLALQVAAREAEQGHGALAHDIREIVDKAKRDARRQRSAEISARLVWHGFFGKSRYPFFSSGASRRPKLRLKGRIQRIMREHREQEELKSHGLSNRRKILVAGLPAKR
jgi:hypothetical protein